MQKHGNTLDRHVRHAVPARAVSRHRRAGSRVVTDSAFEWRLAAELCRYSLDVPESAFPSFLESLHYDTLN